VFESDVKSIGLCSKTANSRSKPTAFGSHNYLEKTVESQRVENDEGMAKFKGSSNVSTYSK